MNNIANFQELLDYINKNFKSLTVEQIAELTDLIAKQYNYNNSKELLESIKSTSDTSNVENTKENENEIKLWDVQIIEIEPVKKMAIIKKIKEIFECPALEAKKHSETLPLIIKKSLLLKDAEKIMKEFTDLGAKLEKLPSSN